MIASDCQTMHSHFINKNVIEHIVIIPITEKQEQKLDAGMAYITINNENKVIYSSDVVCYGEIDFSTGSDDFLTIKGMNWLDDLVTHGAYIPANFNYENNNCDAPYRLEETFNPAKVAQYYHAKLGKPERCCIFKLKGYARRRA